MTADQRELDQEGFERERPNTPLERIARLSELRAANISQLGVLETGVEDGVHKAIFEGTGVLRYSQGVGYLTDERGGFVDLQDMIPQEAQIQVDPQNGRRISPTNAARVRITVETVLVPLSELRGN